MRRDRFEWTETDNKAMVEMINIDGVTVSAIIRDFGHYQMVTISENTNDGELKHSMWASDLEQLKRKMPFFTQELTNDYLKLSFTEV